MAIFGKKETPTQKASNAPREKAAVSGVRQNHAAVLKRPHITEKAVLATERNVYAFEVDRDANKFDVKNAVKRQYGVTPVKVHMVVKQPQKRRSRARGTMRTESGLKKAYVYLKKGDTINF